AIYKDPRSTECIRCLNCVRICPAVRLTNSIMGDKKFKGISEP
ncbi:MAG: 4Fe-4S dicluster domain-containing protein, partial [Nitrospiraceae bacterium]|nr:4Fe-4S dicluster domain-containing protein [Nitrospiraceae bacterium]